MYNYLEAMGEDIRTYIEENVTPGEYYSRDNMETELYDRLWCEDSVIGIDSNTVAEKFLNEDWEYRDTSIRCYRLGQAIAQALDDMDDVGVLDEYI